MSNVTLGFVVSTVAVGAGCAVPPSGRHADLILTGGRVWTGDPCRPEAEALAVSGDRILAVGAASEVERLRGPETRTISLGGRRVVPGLIDAHVHFLGGGEELLAPELRSAGSEEELGRRLAVAAARLPAGTWITSGAWDHEGWAEARLPRREILDRHVPAHPVFVSRLDGHMAVANSLAIRRAGVTRETPDPPGGEIVRDPVTGEPAGVFRDAAMALVRRHVPPPDEAELRERALASLRHAASLGVTGVHDMGPSAAELRVLRDLDRRGELTVRVAVYLPIESLDAPPGDGGSEVPSSRHLKVQGVKAFADGSLGSSTALFLEPYLEPALGDGVGAGFSRGGPAPARYGLAQMDLSEGGELERLVRKARRSGLQPAVHAIGDRAIRSVLDIYGRLDPADARARPRIEHAQHIHPDDLPRFAALGVVASMQPRHAADDGRWAHKRIGLERCDTTYAFRDLLDRGASLAFGSDWPVAPLSPLLGIEAAVTRRTLDGAHPDGWIPRQKIRVEEALRAYTSGAAGAAGDDEGVGTIRPGYLADVVVLAEDILSIPQTTIGRVPVDLTIVGGRIAYERLP